MIGFWMIWACWLGVITVGVAIVAERALASWGVPRRVPWLVACALIVAFTVGGLTMPRSRQSPPVATRLAQANSVARVSPVSGPAAAASIRSRLTARIEAARDRWLDALAPFDLELLALWCAASILLGGRAAIGHLALRRARRTWRTMRLDDVDVLVAERTGPAVVGGRKAKIVVPEWLLGYDAPLRSLVVRHECEHVRARDPLVLALGRALVILFPWNGALWWALARLRLAIEVDCDTRVLAALPDKRRYGLLLIAIAQARTQFGNGPLPIAPAFLRTTQLAKRMKAINSPLRPSRYRSVSYAAAATILGFAVACDTPAPVMPATLTTDGIAFRSSMPTKKEILEWLRTNGEPTEGVEVFDEAAMRQHYGVSKMPELLFDWAAADAAIRRELAIEAPGEKLHGALRVDVDIDVTGRVTRLEAMDVPPLAPGVGAMVALTTDRPPRVLAVDDGSGTPAVSAALKRAVVRALTPLARFTPAELDGRAVPFRNYGMTFDFD